MTITDRLVQAAENASNVLAEIYAKYSTKIGPFATQAQKANGELRAALASLAPAAEKRAPVQGYVQGIPWEMHLRAYNEYVKQCGRQDALIDLDGRNCRGGFHTSELDEFIPGWRNELEELPRLRAQVAALTAQCETDKSRLDFIESGKSYEVSCDYDDNEEEWFWAVHSVRGINDQQWHLLGRGKTLRAAVDSAIAAGNGEGV